LTTVDEVLKANVNGYRIGRNAEPENVTIGTNGQDFSDATVVNNIKSHFWKYKGFEIVSSEQKMATAANWAAQGGQGAFPVSNRKIMK